MNNAPNDPSNFNPAGIVIVGNPASGAPVPTPEPAFAPVPAAVPGTALPVIFDIALFLLRSAKGGDGKGKGPGENSQKNESVERVRSVKGGFSES
jgi:hypothetical protein